VSGRSPLGPDAAGYAARLFVSSGMQVTVHASTWRLDATVAELAGQWLAGWVQAAVEKRPQLAAQAEEYLACRRTQLDAGMLRVAVHHQDVLAHRAERV
jgi:hypothetical protein